jgi:large subunit ribosomal protein L23
MDILIKPLVTEKVTSLNEKGKYGFIVDKNANKVEIKKAVEKMYGVSVEKVTTMRYMGKEKVRYSKTKIMTGKTNNFKKAIVKLTEGEVIDFYSGI